MPELQTKSKKDFQFCCRQFNLEFGQNTKIMAILNVTADSFSQDGIYKHPEQAVDLALKMVADGADIIDVGGESTRPGAAVVPAAEELARILPVINQLVKQIQVPISVDTTKSLVAQAALDAGVSIVNDISALNNDPQMARLIAKYQAGYLTRNRDYEPYDIASDAEERDLP